MSFIAFPTMHAAVPISKLFFAFRKVFFGCLGRRVWEKQGESNLFSNKKSRRIVFLQLTGGYCKRFAGPAWPGFANKRHFGGV